MFPLKALLQLSACKLHTTHNSSIRSDERLTLGTSALETLYGGHFCIINAFDVNNICDTPPAATPQFL